jgi:cyanate permease
MNQAALEAGAPQARPGLWQGRAAVLIGLVLLGIGLRYAVTGLSPLLTDVRQALGIGTAGATLIGMLPTLCFGAAGFLTPLIVRRLGAEGTALLAVSIAALGSLLRPYVDSSQVFILLSAVALFGMGMDREAAALAFSVDTFVTLPMALITPLIANKLNNPTGLAIALAASGPLGYLGILFGIGPAWLMALVAGLAGGAFPLAIAMFNLRSRTTAGSTAIAGFAMGIGYLAGTLGPLLGGWLFAVTGTWAAPLWVYVASVVPMAIGASMMARPGRFLEDGLQK